MQHPKSDTGEPDGTVQMVSTRDLFGRHGPLLAIQRASIKGCSRLHARRLEPAASDAHAGDAHADASARGRGPSLQFVSRSTQTGQPRRQAGMPFRFLVPSSRRQMLLRDDTAGNELPSATPRGLGDCPLGEGAVALAASVSLAFLNATPWRDSASRTTDMPASRLWSTGFRGLK